MSELGYTIFGQPFLGSGDNAGFLYVKPSFQVGIKGSTKSIKLYVEHSSEATKKGVMIERSLVLTDSISIPLPVLYNNMFSIHLANLFLFLYSFCIHL